MARKIERAEVRFDRHTEEWQVLAYVSVARKLVRYPAADYYTSDREDAFNTAERMVEDE